MTDKENNFQEEQTVYCKVRTLLGFAPSDIESDLDKVYGDAALSYAIVGRWLRLFKSGRTDSKDELQSGCPASATSESYVAAVKAAVEDDARCTVDEMSFM
jgi:hypothetical protein